MKKTEKFWDRLSGKTDKIAKKFEQTYIKSLDITRKYLEADDVVLDFACGTGLICTEVADKVKIIYAIDISSKMIDIAKSKSEKRNINNIYFMQSTVFEDQFKKESFDVILVFNVLHLLEDAVKVLKRLNDLLKPGGFIISSTECMAENKGSFLNTLVFLMVKIGIVPYVRFFEVSELEDSIVQADFRIIETESFYNHNQPNRFIVAKKI